MEDVLIVDGYNIIGTWKELQQIAEFSLEEARERLIDILAGYKAFSGIKLIVVFDAYHVVGTGVKQIVKGIEVHYTKEKITADEWIERLVGELYHKRRKIFVATSDFVEQTVILGKGAFRITARELFTRIDQNKREIARKIDDSVQPRNTLDHQINQETKRILEKWRRGES